MSTKNTKTTKALIAALGAYLAASTALYSFAMELHERSNVLAAQSAHVSEPSDRFVDAMADLLYRDLLLRPPR